MRIGSSSGRAAAVPERDSHDDSVFDSMEGRRPHPKLGQWHATAICGNDITSSCLYVAAISTAFAGCLSPLCLLVVAAVLYLFRRVYGEVVTALPLNGGAYNALLNSTSKFKASIAACMTVLSYIATAVISATVAINYFQRVTADIADQLAVTNPLTDDRMMVAIVLLLLGFAVLVRMGISESAKVAFGIFVFHLSTLTVLVFVGGWFFISDGSSMLSLSGSILSDNLKIPDPTNFGSFISLAEAPFSAIAVALFLGFSASLLGISGFESSANFVEEQADGVFLKTLRNMWVAVSVFNPLIALLALAVLPLATVAGEAAHGGALLAKMADAGNHGGLGLQHGWLRFVVSLDAFCVLCGAVLTSYVGVTGLVKRMTLDRCLPQFLLKENRRGTNGRIIMGFFGLCASILYVTDADILVLGGVYTIAFLGVMALFAAGNVLMKVYRSRLRRADQASWFAVTVGLIAVLVGMVGNILVPDEHTGVVDYHNLKYFLLYFLPTMGVIGFMFVRTRLLRLVLVLIENFAKAISSWSDRWQGRVLTEIDKINSLGIVFFTRGDDVANLNRALLYVRANEETKRVKIVHVHPSGQAIPERLKSDVLFLDSVYPEIDLEFLTFEGIFSPELVEELSHKLNVPKNYMFLGAPGERFPHNIAEFGGVRLII